MCWEFEWCSHWQLWALTVLTAAHVMAVKISFSPSPGQLIRTVPDLAEHIFHRQAGRSESASAFIYLPPNMPVILGHGLACGHPNIDKCMHVSTLPVRGAMQGSTLPPRPPTLPSFPSYFLHE